MRQILFLVSILILNIFSGTAQIPDSGKIKLTIYPSDCIVEINDSVYHHISPLQTMITGKHEIKIWSPKHEFIDTTITLIKDSTLSLRFILHYTDDYKTFVHTEVKAYQSKKFNLLVLPKLTYPIDLIFFTSMALLSKKQRPINYEKAMFQLSIYKTGLSQGLIDSSRNNFEMYKRRYNRNIITEYSSYIGMGISTVLFAYWDIKARSKFLKIPYPEFIEDPKLSFTPSFRFNNYSSSAQFGLTFKF